MATVFRATSLDDMTPVAVKVMRPELAEDPSFVARFKREASLSKRMSHPNIVRTLDFGAEGATPFIVMELLEGEDLFEKLSRERRLDEREAASIAGDVCDALAHAHDIGVVHRDLKPENVFLAQLKDGSRAVKVLDFGVAKAHKRALRREGISTPDLTVVGAVLGTPEYMSPEQCRSEMPGPLSDIYSCGAMLYAMLVGRPPFVGGNPVLVAARQVGEEPEAASALRPGLTPALEALVMAMLAKDPDARPVSAASLREELRALLPSLAHKKSGVVSKGDAEIASAPTISVSTVNLPRPPSSRPGVSEVSGVVEIIDNKRSSTRPSPVTPVPPAPERAYAVDMMCDPTPPPPPVSEAPPDQPSFIDRYTVILRAIAATGVLAAALATGVWIGKVTCAERGRASSPAVEAPFAAHH